MFEKVAKTPQICGVQLDFDGNTIPSNIPGFLPFYNSIATDHNFEEVYAGKASLGFSEESVQSNAGTSWKQEFTFRFPATDKDRPLRFQAFKKLKYVKLQLTSGLFIIIGRNDFYQNKLPDVSITSDTKMAMIKVSCQSIAPCGFIPDPRQYALPAYIPVTFQ
jgi:hypothetical protein